MKRKELKILGLSYSQSQIGSYVIVLSEKNGKRKLPLIIKPNDAQRIALEIEGIKSNKPQTHDLVKTIGDVIGYEIKEVFIHTLAEGIFYTKIFVSTSQEEFEVECSAGDGIVFAMLYKCPIYCSQSILSSAGILINDDGTISEETGEEDLESNHDRIVSIEDLEIMMQQAIQNEDYEIAAEIRDRISSLRG